MFKTGNAFIDAFSKGIVLLPLVPAGIIFLRKIYRHTILNFLMILCLLNFSESLGLLLPGLTPENHFAIKNIFFLLEAVALVRIMGSGPGGIPLKNALNSFLVALVSVFLTYFTLEGFDRSSIELDTARHAITLLLVLPALVLLLLGDSLYIFRLPLFWIAAGTAFYFSTLLLVEWTGHHHPVLPAPANAGEIVLIDIAGLVRYFLYALAALNYQPGQTDRQDHPAFPKESDQPRD
ncbi:MAG: hypothetical protein P4L51_08800 [Puia sp.]|nr:hypothetical protein [Puia sp.]